jgi:hypothetical protein
MDTTLRLRHPDPEAHEAGCMNNGAGLPFADPGDTHVDVFCDCHRFTEPKILSNGTDIAWPAGWEPERAWQWRARNDLVPSAELEAPAIAK